jgi:hypothetical protein
MEQNIFLSKSSLQTLFRIHDCVSKSLYLIHQATALDQGCHIRSWSSYNSMSSSRAYAACRHSGRTSRCMPATNELTCMLLLFSLSSKLLILRRINLHPLTLLAKWDNNVWLVIRDNHSSANGKVYRIAWPVQERGKLSRKVNYDPICDSNALF